MVHRASHGSFIINEKLRNGTTEYEWNDRVEEIENERDENGIINWKSTFNNSSESWWQWIASKGTNYMHRRTRFTYCFLSISNTNKSAPSNARLLTEMSMRKKDRIFEENYQLNNGNGNKFTGSFARSITCLFQRICILSNNFHSECSQISHTKKTFRLISISVWPWIWWKTDRMRF